MSSLPAALVAPAGHRQTTGALRAGLGPLREHAGAVPAVARVVTARWTRWSCPLDAATGCGFHFDLPELELRLTGDCAALASEPVTVTYGDHAAQQEFFAAVQAEHERLDHPELSTGLGIPSPRRSTADTRTGGRCLTESRA